MSRLWTPVSAGREAAAKTVAQRVSSLPAVRLALIDNSKENAGLLVEQVGRRLPLAERRSFHKSFSSRPATFIDEVAAWASAVVNGVGD
jgi:hypothetical protein